MDNIITVTLNPVIDIHYYANDFVCGKDNIANEVCTFAAGKGMNVSRALYSAGISAEAFLLLGEENASEYLNLSKNYSVPISCITTSGSVRQNISINTPSQETRVCMKNYSVPPAILPVLATKIIRKVSSESVIVFSGSLPLGISPEDFANFILLLKKTIPELKIVIDCPSISLELLNKIEPFLIKPNLEEATKLLGLSQENQNNYSIDFITNLTKEIYERSNSNYVVTSCGSMGAVFAFRDTSNNIKLGHIKAPSVKDILTTVGAGDSMLAGILAEMLKQSHSNTQCSFVEAVKWGVAFGSAACMTKGTNPPSYSNAVSIFKSLE